MRGNHDRDARAWLRLSAALALALGAWLLLLAPGGLATNDLPASVNGPGAAHPIARESEPARHADETRHAVEGARRTRAAERRRIDSMSPMRWLARFGDVSADPRRAAPDLRD